jgi:hypothetical protein
LKNKEKQERHPSSERKALHTYKNKKKRERERRTLDFNARAFICFEKKKDARQTQPLNPSALRALFVVSRKDAAFFFFA